MADREEWNRRARELEGEGLEINAVGRKDRLKNERTRGSVYKGGCALMLRIPIEPCARLHVTVAKWIEPPWVIVNPADYHLTLQFVGRNLSRDKIGAVVYSAFLFARDPFTAPVVFTGEFEILSTFKERYLVARVNGESLMEPRRKLEGILRELGVVPKDVFEFKPHVTLAEAAPTVGQAGTPDPISPFSVQVEQMEVKYGPHRMVVEL